MFAMLALGSSRDRSATWDEPIHLTAGYAAAAAQDFRVDPSHPPLLRMWAALPLLAMESVRFDAAAIDAAAPASWLPSAYGFAHRFMYRENDADRMLTAARAMIVLLGIVLGVLVFWWAREWLGLVPAAGAIILFTLEPNLQAHASLVTTDLGLTTFLFGAVYFLWRTCQRVTRLNVAAAAAFAALAAASKFSAVVLAPIVFVLLAIAVARRTVPWRVAGGVGVLMLAAGVAGIWTAYGFTFLPSDSPAWAFNVAGGEVASRHPSLAALATWVNDHRLLPNAYTQGFLYSQSSAAAMPSFLAGARSADGWWYYLPVAFLIKTPIALLLLLAAGVIVSVTRPQAFGVQSLAFVFVPIAAYAVVAMASGINLGLRHLLPIYPFVLLAAAAAIKTLAATRARWVPVSFAVLAVAGVGEFARAYPYTLTFFNQFVGGPAEGYRYLADSNLGWGGNLKRLKAWMDRSGVRHINLAYFGQADPAYYGIDCTHLPGAPGFAIDAIARPRLPGYVAVSPTIMHGVYSPPEWRLFYEPFARLQPAAVIGDSLRIYWIEHWPLPVADSPDERRLAAHRRLGDALLFGLQWPEQAALHYRAVLDQRPRDVEARLQLGVALTAGGQIAPALDAFRTAVDVDPEHGGARLMLARASFGSGDLPAAATHAEQAVRLRADDADAHDLLGRVRAVQGRFPEALASFRRALRIDPSHAEARKHAARLSGAP